MARAQQASLRIDGDELIGVAEIAELAGVTKAAVANWRARGSTGFPPPAVETKSGPLYRKPEIEAWLSERDVPAQQSKPDEEATDEPLGIESALWATADRLRGSVDASQYRHLVLGLLFLRFITGARRKGLKRPAGTDWESITSVPPKTLAAALDKATQDLAVANPSIAPALTLSFRSTPIDERRLAGLVEVLERVPVNGSEEDRDLLGRAYEYFLGRFASLEGRSGGEFYTPTSVVRLLVEMIEPTSGTVYDPCCGSGGMFIQSARFREAHATTRKDLSLFGQELNAGTRRLAIMNLAMHGLQADLGDGEADTFHNDLHEGLRVNHILANPPFNISDWGVDSLLADPRWEYGVPPNANANLAWVQHMVWHLNDSGRAGIVLANGSLTSDQPAEYAIRKGLVDDDLVACMVSLPGQLFYSTTIPVTLWFIDREKPKKCRDKVLLIDARQAGTKVTRTHRVLRDEDIENIAATYHAWRSSGQGPDDGTFAVSVDRETIAENDYSLAPTRYVSLTSDEEVDQDLEALRAEYADLVAEASRLDELILNGVTG